MEKSRLPPSLPAMKTWSRRSEWDYSWVNRLESPAEVILCSSCEHSRCALSCLPGGRFPCSLEDFSFSSWPHLLANINTIGPISFWLTHCPASWHFPFDPWRALRRQAEFDPERVLELLDDFSDPRPYQNIQIRWPPNLIRARALTMLAEIRKQFSSGPGAGAKRGGGARVRQAKAALKNLGALKLRCVLSAPHAIRYTEQILGRPLFAAESQWSRARQAALATLRPYHAEAAMLLAAANEKRSLGSGANC
jgi:hypothetical protein